MTRRAVVHIGTFKTGSTSIQAFLSENAGRLIEQGVHIPKSVGAPNQHGLAIYSLSLRETTGLIRFYELQDRERREARRAEIAEALRAEMSSLLSNVTSVVFSNEHLSGLNTVAEIEQLRDLLAPYFERIEIIVYLRRQDQRIISDYTQKVRDGYTKRLDLLNYKPSEGLDLLAFLDKWASVFGADAIKPRIFSASEFVNGDLIDDFISSAGISPDDKFVKSQISNAGLSHKAIQFLRALNEHVPNYVDGKRNPLRQRLLPYLAEEFSGGGFRATKTEAENLLNSLEAANAAAGEKYFGRRDIFSSSLSNYDDMQLPDATFEDAIEIAGALWNRQAEHIEILNAQLAALRVLTVARSEKAELFARRILDADCAADSYYPTFLEVFSALHAELRETRRLLELERTKEGKDK